LWKKEERKMDMSLQLSLTIAGIAITLIGLSITLMVQWSTLLKKNQLRNLAFGTVIILFVCGLLLTIKAIYTAWGFRDVIEVIIGIALGITIALVRDWTKKRMALKNGKAVIATNDKLLYAGNLYL
jgi:hypothetical protein